MTSTSTTANMDRHHPNVDDGKGGSQPTTTTSDDDDNRQHNTN